MSNGRYKERLALVTGASAGIGAGITRALVKYGMKVIGVARRAHRVQVLQILSGRLVKDSFKRRIY